MIVAVIGSRDWPDLPRVNRYVTKLAAKHPEAIIVSGGAHGVDQEAEKVALWSGLDIISYRPYEFDSIDGGKEWSVETVTRGERAQALVVEKSRRINPPTFKSFGQAAMFRNGWIVQDSEITVAFHCNGSPGTTGALRRAREFGRQVFVYTPQ